jgi:thymidylate kinase
MKITVSGPQGAGKTNLCSILNILLKRNGLRVSVVPERNEIIVHDRPEDVYAALYRILP